MLQQEVLVCIEFSTSTFELTNFSFLFIFTCLGLESQRFFLRRGNLVRKARGCFSSPYWKTKCFFFFFFSKSTKRERKKSILLKCWTLKEFESRIKKACQILVLLIFFFRSSILLFLGHFFFRKNNTISFVMMGLSYFSAWRRDLLLTHLRD